MRVIDPRYGLLPVGPGRSTNRLAMAFLDQVLAFGLGLLAGLLTPMTLGTVRSVRARLVDAFGPTDAWRAAEYEPLGLVTINEWSPARPLTVDNLDIQVVPTPSQDWCDTSDLQTLRDSLPDEGGPSATMVDYDVDHRESPYGQTFRMRVAHSYYADFLALRAYADRHPEFRPALRERFSTGSPSDTLKSSAPSVIAINVSLVSGSKHVLAIKRSRAVATYKGYWSLGPLETLSTASRVPGEKEDLFTLGHRCLREEVGLRDDKVRRLIISWIGFDINFLLTLVVAQAVCDLRRDEIDDCIRTAHSSFEAEHWEWLPLSRATLSEIRDRFEYDRNGRVWVPAATVAADELWRMHRALMML